MAIFSFKIPRPTYDSMGDYKAILSIILKLIQTGQVGEVILPVHVQKICCNSLRVNATNKIIFTYNI